MHSDTSTIVVPGSKNESGLTSCTVSGARKGA